MAEKIQNPQKIPHKSQQRRVTIALLTQGAIEPNNHSIWMGAAAAARDAGANLVCFPGRPLNSPAEFESQRNIIYRMVDAQTVDGVVFWGLNPFISLDETYAFFGSLPHCRLSQPASCWKASLA